MPTWYLKSFYMTKSLCDGVGNKKSICGVCKQCVYSKSGFVQKCMLCFNLFHDSCHITSTCREVVCPIGMTKCPCAIYLHVGDIPVTAADDNDSLLPITMATPHHDIQGTIVTNGKHGKFLRPITNDNIECTFVQHDFGYSYFLLLTSIDIFFIVFSSPTLELENYLPAQVTLRRNIEF